MANSKQAAKRARQSDKHLESNRWQKSRMYTHIKKVLKAIEAGNKEVAQNEMKLTTSFIDRLSSKGLIHKNKAARHKSRLSKHIKEMAA